MTRRIPIIPTIVVVAAAATMVALGVWQLGRADEKEALIARYEAAFAQQTIIEIPETELEGFQADFSDSPNLFQKGWVECAATTSEQAIAGRNDRGRSGYVHIAPCLGRSYDQLSGIKLGWSTSPQPVEWEGGRITGRVVPGGETGIRFQADQPQAGLAPLAQPDPSDLPNNHLAYAGQWFFFALTALLIYGFALRRKWREQD